MIYNLTIKTVQSQVAAYQLEKSKPPNNIEQLTNGGFLTNEQTMCRNGKKLKLKEVNGNVTVEVQGEG